MTPTAHQTALERIAREYGYNPTTLSVVFDLLLAARLDDAGVKEAVGTAIMEADACRKYEQAEAALDAIKAVAGVKV